MRKPLLKSVILASVAAALVSTATPVVAQLSQNLWQYSNPKPFGFNVNASSFIDNNNGIMVGDGIAKTNDGGVTWGYFAYWFITNAGAIAKPTLNEVQMVTSNVAYVSGSNATLLKSIDGGLNWTRLTTPFEASGTEITSLSFLNVNQGWIVGEPIGGNVTAGITTLYKTIDGGNTWTLELNLPKLPATRLGSAGSLTNPFRYDSSRAKSLYRIRMVRSDLGYVSGAAGLLWKYDGTGWKNYSATNFRMGLDTLASGTQPPQGPQSQSYRGLAVVSDTLAVISSNSNGVIIQVNTAKDTARPLLRTWGGNVALSPLGFLSSSSFYNIANAPDGKLVIPEGSGKYLLSADSGFTWKVGTVYPVGSGYEGLAYRAASVTPSRRYVFGGSSGVVADSLNGTWRRPYINVRPGAGFNKVQFADASSGMVVGGFGNIISTNDGGANWINRSNANDAAAQVSYFAMDYYKPDSFFLATSNGAVRFSADQGQTFDQLFADSFKTASNSNSPVFYAMDWINSQMGWVASWRGHSPSSGQPNLSSSVIFYTKDGGLTWDSSKSLPRGPWPIISNVAQNYTPQVRDIKFVNQRIGFAASSRSSIWKTTDGGVNWSRVYQAPDSASFSGSFISISILDSNNIYVAGNGGKVVRTNNGGTSWIDAKANLGTFNINGIIAYDSLQAFVFSPSGQMWVTADGGKVWGLQQAPVPIGAGNGILTDGAFVSINPGCGSPVCNALWVVGTGGVVFRFGSDRILPVKFSQLTGASTNDGNQLFWTAFEQENVKQFEIELSADGKNFKQLSERIYPFGAGVQGYKWLHTNPTLSKSYYRLKAYDKDGSTSYSNIVSLGTLSAPRWNYYLSNGTVNLTNTKVAQGKVVIRVVNTAGQTMAAKEVMHSGGAFNNYVILPQHSTGVYVVQVQSAQSIQSFKVVME
jgi:photosystem II stability/assembly factor-like uncharacterized protein